MPRGLRSNPLFGHASLIQSGFVQSRMKPRTTRALTEVIVRSFDDGRDTGPTPNSHCSRQYDVLASNPTLNITVYERESVATSAGESAGNNGHICDVSAANPSFDPTPYEGSLGEPQVGQEQASTTTTPRAAPSASAADTRALTSQQSTPVRTSSFTSRELDKLVTDADFRADLDAILGAASTGQEKPATMRGNGPSQAARRQIPDRRERNEQGRGRSGSRGTSTEPAQRELSAKPDEHAIFDKIAEKMQFATAYELPAISLSRRFDRFDRQGPRRGPPVRPHTLSNSLDPSVAATALTMGKRAAPSPIPESPAAPSLVIDTVDAGTPNQQDVEPNAPKMQPPQLAPAPPQTLRPYSEAELVATYGDPRVDPESWAAENVITAQVPQLAGVLGPGEAAFDGTVAFHRLGMRSLSDLFAAWELAGLMSKVLSFDGGHAAQSPHGEGVDAHAWAIAFDINSKWNPAGDEPVPMQAEGSVAELVEIANRHGFVWGGHDPRRKAGLHFELGHRI